MYSFILSLTSGLGGSRLLTLRSLYPRKRDRLPIWCFFWPCII